MSVLDTRMGLVISRWKISNEASVTRSESVPGLPNLLLTAADRILTGTVRVSIAGPHTNATACGVVWDLSGAAPASLRSFQPHSDAIATLAPHPPYYALSSAAHRLVATPLPPYDGTTDDIQVRIIFRDAFFWCGTHVLFFFFPM